MNLETVRTWLAAALKKKGAAKSSERRSFWKRLLKASPVIMGFIVLSSLMQHWGWLTGFERAGLDTFIRLRDPVKADHVVIVGISEEDYTTLFNETSPLAHEKLRQLIDAIALGKPKLIGIDLDTSSKREFEQFQIASTWPLIVWARDARKINEQNNDKRLIDILKDILNPFSGDKDVFAPAAVLAGDGGGLNTGIALLPEDSDGAVRRYYRTFKTNSGAVNSFPWAIVMAYSRLTGGNNEDSGPSGNVLLLNFSVDKNTFKPISASEVLRLAGDPNSAWQDDGPLKDKIVLLGGYYNAARDEHVTPMGRTTGVDLMAQIIETDLHGTGIRPPSKLLVWLIGVLASIAMLSINSLPRDGSRLRFTLIAVPIIALVSSYLAFSSFALWAYFVPVLIALLIQQLNEQINKYRKLLKAQVHDHVKELGADLGEKVFNRLEVNRAGNDKQKNSEEISTPLQVKQPLSEVARGEGKSDANMPAPENKNQGQAKGKKTDENC